MTRTQEQREAGLHKYLQPTHGTGVNPSGETVSIDRHAIERFFLLARHCARTKTQPGDNEQHQAESFLRVLYNALGIPIAAGVLYPFFGILLSSMIAAAAMSFSLCR